MFAYHMKMLERTANEHEGGFLVRDLSLHCQGYGGGKAGSRVGSGSVGNAWGDSWVGGAK